MIRRFWGIGLAIVVVAGASFYAFRPHSLTPAEASSSLHPSGVVQADPAPSGSLGLPVDANWRVLPVWTAQGIPMYVNAGLLPIVMFPEAHPATALSIAGKAKSINPRAQIIYVAAGFPNMPLAKALPILKTLSQTLKTGVFGLQGPSGGYMPGGHATLAYVGHMASQATVLAASDMSRAELRTALTNTLDGIPPVVSKPSTPQKPSTKSHTQSKKRGKHA